MRVSERAYVTLMDEIQTGALPPGTVLSEVEQASRLGVSRTPLREALRRIAADGLVVQQSPRVTVVAAIDEGDIRNLFELRRALEEAAARAAAVRGERALFADLARWFCLDRLDLDSQQGRDDYYRAIARFDTELDRAVDNEHLSAALRPVRAHLVRVRWLARDNPERLRASVGEHQLIASAIAAGDPDLAAHATHVHLHNALTHVLSALPESQ